MSHFNLPRINFLGKFTVDAPTGNNVYYAPLVFFNPLKVEGVLPPRIYFTKNTFKKGFDINYIKKNLPVGVHIKVSPLGMEKDVSYIEILPINKPSILREWAITPIGKFPLDKAYIPIYKALKIPNTGNDLMGEIASYWNYFGTMKAVLGWKEKDGTISSVTVTSIAVSEENNEKAGSKVGEKIYMEGSKDCPEDLEEILGATVTMDNVFGDPNTYSGVMVDLDPTFALYTQMFVDSFGIFKGNSTFLKGKPCKASLRFANAFRVENEQMPLSGSGNFVSTIPVSALEGGVNSPIMKIFRKYGDPMRAIKGVFIRNNLLEVQENRPPNYLEWGNVPNPAKLTVAGSIGPWYEGEMQSLVMGRQLITDSNYPINTQTQTFLGPCTLIDDKAKKEIVIDIINIIPHINKSLKPNQVSSPTDVDALYETYPLGRVDLVLEEDETNASAKPNLKTEPILIGSIIIDQENFPRKEYLSKGGILRIPYDVSDLTLTSKSFALYGTDNKGNRARFLKENPYMISTDQAGLYANQGDDPINGYVSYGYPKEHCVIRIYKKGVPVPYAIPICIQSNIVTDGGALSATDILRNTMLSDKDIVTFPTNGPANSMFLFLPYHMSTPLKQGQLQGRILFTGSFVSLRVLPVHDYGKYLDPRHKDYPTLVTWKVIYEEIFKTIELVYPAMSQILPFTKENWDNATMAAQILNRVSDNNWDSFQYMPPTRDLSDDQKLLIYKWAEQFGLVTPSMPTTPSTLLTSGKEHHTLPNDIRRFIT